MTTGPHRTVATVLVITGDPNIEALVGELVAFAGHRPLYDVTVGAAGASIRRSRPDVVLLDLALWPKVIEACLRAADEVGSAAVLMSSTESKDELASHARARHRLYFPLPSGPRPLARILERALGTHDRPVAIPFTREGETAGSVHPAFRAALARVAGARVESDTRQGRRALRAAITDYARQLKAASLTVDDAMELVRNQIGDCARTVGVEASMSGLLSDSDVWARQAYNGA